MQSLPGQQRHSCRHQHGSDPAPAIHFFMQEDFRRECIADERERRGGWRDQAHVSPRERKQQAEERRLPSRPPQKKFGFPSGAAQLQSTIPPAATDRATSPTCFIARASRTSPTTEAKATATNPAPGVHVFHRCHLAAKHRLRSAVRSTQPHDSCEVSDGPSGNESHSARDQRDPQPAQRADLLMQRELRHQRQQNISQRSRRQHISEIRPGQRVHVRRKKSRAAEQCRLRPMDCSTARITLCR